MYSIIRLMISGILFCVLLFVISKLKYKFTKKNTCLFICFFVCFWGFLNLIPIENLFITFKSPKTAIEYYQPGMSNIELIVNGDECDFVVSKKQNNVKSYSIIPKTSDGWKVGLGKDVKILTHSFIDGFSISVYQYKNTDEYFVSIRNAAGGKIIITDTFESSFQVLEEFNSQLNKSFFTYYAYISEFDEGYSIMLESEDGSIFKYNLS